MKNLAAVIPAEKAQLEVQEVEVYEPGPRELLVENELIALNPVEAKMAQLNIPPTRYPAIIGVSFGGTVAAVGSGVGHFRIGDKVAAYSPRSGGNRYGAYQRYALVRDTTASKVPDGVDLAAPVSLTGNLSTVVGLLSGTAGIEQPDLDRPPARNGKKILIYGGTSSVGNLAVQYAVQAGWTVVTTTSPKHETSVSKLGAVGIIDHTQDAEVVVKDSVQAGPYDTVVDCISLPNTVKATADVLAAQGGGKLYTLLPAFGPENLPSGVARDFRSWSLSLAEERNAGLESWAFHTYLPRGLSSGKIVPLRTEKMTGGLGGLNEALDTLAKGVSGLKLLVDPWG